jgi:hypothetical protein
VARSEPATQRITLAGLNLALTAPNADGDIIPAGTVALVVDNGGGSPITVTAVTPGTVAGLAIADATLSVPAGARRYLGPFPTSVFAQPADAVDGPLKVLINYSSITSVTRALVSF